MIRLKFDSNNKHWKNDSEKNLMFLKDTQRTCNYILKENGYLLLDQVLELLGVNNISTKSNIGWIYNRSIPFLNNYIDFGIYDISKDECRKFVNGYTTDITLEFNTDGDIADYLFDTCTTKEIRNELFNYPWLLNDYFEI